MLSASRIFLPSSLPSALNAFFVWLSLSDQVLNSLPAGLGGGLAVGEPWHLAALQPVAPSNLEPVAISGAEGCCLTSAARSSIGPNMKAKRPTAAAATAKSLRQQTRDDNVFRAIRQLRLSFYTD